MAPAPGHRLGQIIGEMFELAVKPPLEQFVAEHELYLDGKGQRPARRGKKVTWTDDLGNKHDLDHVIERGGTCQEIGIPAAFIETAWRRYTKHSKNKAQEIQAAVLPILAKWSHVKPFCGVMLAGDFTASSLEQLRTSGFSVLHIPYPTIIAVFAEFGIDVAYDEGSPDEDLQLQIDRYEMLPETDHVAIGTRLREAAEDEIATFMGALRKAILRQISTISILPLHGSMTSCNNLKAAIELLRNYKPPAHPGSLVRFEVIVRYDNDDRIVADFANAADAIAFLASFR